MSAVANENMEVDNNMGGGGGQQPQEELVPVAQIKREVDETAAAETAGEAENAAAAAEVARASEPTDVAAALDAAIEAVNAVIAANAAEDAATAAASNATAAEPSANDNGQPAEPMETNACPVDTAPAEDVQPDSADKQVSADGEPKVPAHVHVLWEVLKVPFITRK